MKLSNRIKLQTNYLKESESTQTIAPNRLTGVLKNQRTTLKKLWEIYNSDLMTLPEQIVLMTRHKNADEKLIKAICNIYSDNAQNAVALLSEDRDVINEVLIPLIAINLDDCKKITPYKTFEEWENVRKAALKIIYQRRMTKYYYINTLSFRDCMERFFIAETFGSYESDGDENEDIY